MIILIQDVDKFCNSLAELYSNVSKVGWNSQSLLVYDNNFLFFSLSVFSHITVFDIC